MDKADPLDGTKYHIDRSAHPVGGEAADKGIEFGGRGADSKEEGNLNEEDYKGRSTNTC